MLAPNVRLGLRICSAVGGGLVGGPADHDFEALGSVGDDQMGDDFRIDRRTGVRATMTVSGGKFVVRKGSLARKNTGRKMKSYSGLKQSLIQSGRLVADGESYRFAEDVAFSSPSAAATIIFDGETNGKRVWRHVKTGVSFKDWEHGRT